MKERVIIEVMDFEEEPLYDPYYNPCYDDVEVDF